MNFIKLCTLLMCLMVLEQSTTQTHTVYLPMVTNDEHGHKRGLAPSSYLNLEDRVEMLGVTSVRGWQMTSAPWDSVAGVRYTPNLWCTHYSRTDNGFVTLYDQLSILDALGEDYDGELLFLNEPDLTFYGRHGQCEITAYGAAQLYIHTRIALPHAKLIGPGVSHIDFENDYMWTRMFIEHVIQITGFPPNFHAWDVHTYMDYGDPLDPINHLESILVNRYGIENPKFHIGEWGSCSPTRLIEMQRSFDEDPRVSHHYFYDQYNAWWDGPSRCLSLFEEDTNPLKLTVLGHAYVYGSHRTNPWE